MVTIAFGGARTPAAAPVVAPEGDDRSIWLESLDRTLRVNLTGPIWLEPGFVGLEQAPVSLVVGTATGVPGGFFDDAQTVTRPVTLPLSIYASTQSAVRAAVAALVDVVQPGTVLTPEGTFRIVCSSRSGTRELTVAYLSGLEGADNGNFRWDRFALNLLAVDPFARDREARKEEFSLGASTGSMTSANPATAGPRRLGSSVVIGENMPIDIVSGIPVNPRIDIIGPFDPLTVTASTGLSISVPDGVDAGSTLTIITDPRQKSIRLDGALAAGRVSRSSWLGAPFQPGRNYLSVAASGAADTSRIVLSWRGGWRSLW